MYAIRSYYVLFSTYEVISIIPFETDFFNIASFALINIFNNTVLSSFLYELKSTLFLIFIFSFIFSGKSFLKIEIISSMNLSN